MKTPSIWCRTNRACWRWIFASRACLMGEDTPAGQSTIWVRMRWSASWRFEVCCLNFTSHNTIVSKWWARAWPQPGLSLTVFNKAQHDKSPSPQPLSLICYCETSVEILALKINRPIVFCQLKFRSHQWLLSTVVFFLKPAWSPGLTCWFEFSLFLRSCTRERRGGEEMSDGTKQQRIQFNRNSNGLCITG